MARDEESSNKWRYNVKIGIPIRKEISTAVSNDNDTTDVMTTFGLGILKSSLYLDAIAEIPLLAKTIPALTRHLFRKQDVKLIYLFTQTL